MTQEKVQIKEEENLSKTSRGGITPRIKTEIIKENRDLLQSKQLNFLQNLIITKEDTTRIDLKKDSEETQVEDQETDLAEKEDDHFKKIQTDLAGIEKDDNYYQETEGFFKK